jgi:arylsulfatase A-like enzyme
MEMMMMQCTQIELHPSRLTEQQLFFIRASPACGTSRFSTLTGRYPSRSAYNRERNVDQDVASVVIPNTKLQNVGSVPDGNDCSQHNLAYVLQHNGYTTGAVGKWHLAPATPQTGYDYDNYRSNDIQACGFDFAESIYAENLQGFWDDGAFSHNMEYMTEQAIDFIRSANTKPFFLYFNPTVPHSSGNVVEALTNFPCTHTVAGTLEHEPVVPGMTQTTTCDAYRSTVLERAQGTTDNVLVGSIWIDDAIGALFQVLQDENKLDNTLFLFQLDHGDEGKATLWEPGVRMAQFVHFPKAFHNAIQFDGMVSTIDIAPTMLDYAGIDASSPGYYPMDGTSWKSAVENDMNAKRWNENRCLVFEIDQDRALRCGCHKYMSIQSGSATFLRGQARGMDVDNEVLYNLCDENLDYELVENQEQFDLKDGETELLTELASYQKCHLDKVKANREELDYSTCGPTPAPTLAPTPPTICFSGETVVQIKDTGTAQMSSLKLGDQVLVADGRYEKIYSFGHCSTNMTGIFLRLLPSGLELSPDHMVFVHNRGAIPASMVKIGDRLSDGDRITAIKSVERIGAYAPFTPSGTIVVNNVVASSYVAFQESSVLKLGAWPTPFTFQWLAHTFEAPHRLSCRYAHDCTKGESYTGGGLSVWVSNASRLARWLLNQHPAVQVIILVPLVSLLAVASVFEDVSFVVLVVAGLVLFRLVSLGRRRTAIASAFSWTYHLLCLKKYR